MIRIAGVANASVDHSAQESLPDHEGTNVKLIIAIVQPSRLEQVKEALTEVEVFRLTVLDCLGFGRQKGQKTAFRGQDVSVNLLRKVQLQIAVNDEFVQPTINAILKGAKTGENSVLGLMRHQ
jgi:nitrogen regulatory protein P-II 1